MLYFSQIAARYYYMVERSNNDVNMLLISEGWNSQYVTNIRVHVFFSRERPLTEIFNLE